MESGEIIQNPDGSVHCHLTIVNKRGLHARASAKFVKLVEKFDAEVSVTKDGQTVGGTSIMGLMTLAAAKGCGISVCTSGNQAMEVMKSLKELVESGFGEDE